MEKRRFRQYVNYFKRKFDRKKEFRLTVFYAVGYFIFITALLLFSTTAGGQTPGIVIKAANPARENFVKPMNEMMDRIYTLQMTNDFDRDYAAIMQEFQRGGIGLCKIYQMAGNDPVLEASAKVNTVEMKEHEKEMKSFDSKDKVSGNHSEGHNIVMATLNKMVKEMKNSAQSGQVEQDFASAMVIYNWAGSELAKAELKYGLNCELKQKSGQMFEDFVSNQNVILNWMGGNCCTNGSCSSTVNK